MIKLRKSEERGHFDHGWLDTHHTFSFADYFDPEHMGFRSLRVINEDKVAPGAGFPTHGHRDMEIVTYILAGSLEHKDSLGSGSVIRPGDLQRMSAGTGVRHSEFNPDPKRPVHLLQIWLLPDRSGLQPEYEEKHFEAAELRGRLRVVCSPDGRDSSLRIHQDAVVMASLLAKGQSAEHGLAPGRHAWVQVARGEVELNGEQLRAGDGAALSEEPTLQLQALADAELLVFDLA